MPIKPTPIAIAIVLRGDEILVGQRNEAATLPGKWEFPGGKVDAGELIVVAAARECREETGIEVSIGDEIACVEHSYDHDDVVLHFFLAAPIDDCQPRPPFEWIDCGRLRELEFPAANSTVLELLIGQS